MGARRGGSGSKTARPPAARGFEPGPHRTEPATAGPRRRGLALKISLWRPRQWRLTSATARRGSAGGGRTIHAPVGARRRALPGHAMPCLARPAQGHRRKPPWSRGPGCGLRPVTEKNAVWCNVADCDATTLRLHATGCRARPRRRRHRHRDAAPISFEAQVTSRSEA